jgi:putative transposase
VLLRVYRLYLEERLMVRRRGGRKRASFPLSTIARGTAWRSSPTPRSPACVARELDRILASRAKPRAIVSDNGTELTSNAMLRWADENRIAWHYIAPGKPTQNAYVESFNGRLRTRSP